MLDAVCCKGRTCTKTPEKPSLTVQTLRTTWQNCVWTPSAQPTKARQTEVLVGIPGSIPSQAEGCMDQSRSIGNSSMLRHYECC